MELDMDMDTIENIEMDPDYKDSQSVSPKKRKLEDNKKATEIKSVEEIIFNECTTEEKLRLKQLEEIELKIYKSQKLLHVLRYAVVTSFYNSNNLQQIIEEETSSPNNYLNAMLTTQNKIHPAIKKLLLGNDPNIFNILNSKRTSKQVNANNKLEIKNKPIKQHENSKNSSKMETTALPVSNQEMDISLQTRKKVQHTILVGNISYFKKSLEQENNVATYKWMVYVKICKGDQKKNNEDLSDRLIRKVTFYLHPSYKPSDVVEIKHPPFHLSRIGWGEFPLRIQICFKSARNKPVDIIHQLKLDNTFNERQTLGNETTETIFLYEDSLLQTTSTAVEQQFETYEKNTTESEYFDSSSFSDPINNEDFNENKHCVTIHDHCYSSLPFSENLLNPFKEESKFTVEEQPFTELIYGLGTNYLNSRITRMRRILTRK